MLYGEIKYRQKVEVLLGDCSKEHLVMNFFRAPTPLERFRYAATLKWRRGVVVDKKRFKFSKEPCSYDIVVAFNDCLIKNTTPSHRDGYGFLPIGYLDSYTDGYDYIRIHFNKNKESHRVRPVLLEEQSRDLSQISTALAADPWTLDICCKNADDWTDAELERFTVDFYCKHFGGTKESIKAYDFVTAIRDIRTISGIPPI